MPATKPLTTEDVAATRREDNQRAATVRGQLAAEAEAVMNNSRPTPTTADIDAIIEGRIGHDEKEVVDNPEMPPVHLQREAIAGTDQRAAYRTRQMATDRPAVARREPDSEPRVPRTPEPAKP